MTEINYKPCGTLYPFTNKGNHYDKEIIDYKLTSTSGFVKYPIVHPILISTSGIADHQIVREELVSITKADINIKGVIYPQTNKLDLSKFLDYVN